MAAEKLDSLRLALPANVLDTDIKRLRKTQARLDSARFRPEMQLLGQQ
jgi:hypothetical protein